MINLTEEGFLFEQSSIVDPVGRIVRRDNRIFRAIYPEYASQVIHHLNLAIKNDWFSIGLVGTRISEFQINGYGIVLEHERVPFSTQRGEWSAIGLQRAAICHLQLCIAMLDEGLCLKDAHTWNILFNGTRPVYIDFSSISSFKDFDQRYWLSEFNSSFLAPLILFSYGQAGLARSLLQEHAHGAGSWLLEHDPARLVNLPTWQEINAGTLEALCTMIADLKFPIADGEWQDYMPEHQTLRTKDHQFQRYASQIEYRSVIDIGANRGIHAQMCAKTGADVLACDIEESCLNSMFDTVDRQKLPVTPLYMDILRPLGSGGFLCSQAPAQTRLKADLVVSLALVHHVAFRRRIYVDALIRTLASFSRSAALIEFVPDDDVHVRNWNLPPLRNYSLEGFYRELRKYYEYVVDVPFSDPPRRLFVCRGKRSKISSALTCS